LAAMPPTRAAARKTNSGRSRSKKACVAPASARSSSVWVRVISPWWPAACKQRVMALPTRPRWPAT